MEISRKTLIMVSIIIIAFIILGVSTIFLPNTAIEQAKKYKREFYDSLDKHGLKFNRFKSRIDQCKAERIILNFTKWYARELKINVEKPNITRIIHTDQSTSPPPLARSVELHLYDKYIATVNVGDHRKWDIMIEDVTGKIIWFNVPEYTPYNQCRYPITTLNKSYAKTLVKNLLLKLNYTMFESNDLDIVITDIQYLNLSMQIIVNFAFKVYGYIEYDPFPLMKRRYLNSIVIDPCSMRIVGLTIEPTILLLYEKHVLKPLKPVIDYRKALDKALDYIETCTAVKNGYIKNYSIVNYSLIWYYVDVDNDYIVDTISIGYFFKIETENVYIEKSILGIPVKASMIKVTNYVIVDAQTGAVSYVISRIARPELCLLR